MFRRLLLSFLLIWCTAAAAQATPPPLPSADLPEQRQILPVSFLQIDLTGDGKQDHITLHRLSDSQNPKLYRDLTLEFHDSATGQTQSLDLHLSVYQLQWQFLDLTGDGIPEFMMWGKSPGSGGIQLTRILSWQNGTLCILWGAKEDRGVVCDGQFLDQGLIRVSFPSGHTVDLHGDPYRPDYQRLNLYDKQGQRSSSDISPQCRPFSQLTPVTSLLHPLSSTALHGVQILTGAYNADSLGEIHSEWKYKEKSWHLTQLHLKVPLK